MSRRGKPGVYLWGNWNWHGVPLMPQSPPNAIWAGQPPPDKFSDIRPVNQLQGHPSKHTTRASATVHMHYVVLHSGLCGGGRRRRRRNISGQVGLHLQVSRPPGYLLLTRRYARHCTVHSIPSRRVRAMAVRIDHQDPNLIVSPGIIRCSAVLLEMRGILAGTTELESVY